MVIVTVMRRRRRKRRRSKSSRAQEICSKQAYYKGMASLADTLRMSIKV